MMDTTSVVCPFCNPASVLLESELAYAIADANPVTPGHILIIPKRHVADYFIATEVEKFALHALLNEAKHYLDSKHTPDGYNVGINVGEVAGQTIPHVHLHLIPRYKGDTPNPRGGVRGVIPDRQSY
jgi:diadenosine tetraphosphate (Ap4A) HIT family hydrolase